MNNDRSKRIKYELENTFHISFDVNKVFDQNEKYSITPKESNRNSFIIVAIIRDDIRLIVQCEPDQYGKEFLNNINKSEKELRNNFINYWSKVDDGDLKVLINDSEVTKEQFMNNTNIWNKFVIKYSKAPYYLEGEDKNKKVTDVVSWICAMILSITDYSIEGFEEGSITTIVSKKYERNPINRKLCLAFKGYTCSVCGMNFEEKYGSIGKEFIHVHHVVPVHLMGENYRVDPVKDLYPICPNCHAMLHRKDPPYTIEELKEIVEHNK